MKSHFFILSGSSLLDLDDKNKYLLPRDHLMYHLKHGLFEANLIRWCRGFGDKSKSFLDIGAHTGTYAIELADCFSEVHAFEPQSGTFYALFGSVALSGHENIECHRKGLGSPFQRGKKDLFIYSSDGGGSSLIEATGYKEKQTIDVATLDDLGLNGVGFIKMDVEGNEYDVLLGSSNTLKNSGYPKILFESNEGVPENLKEYLTSMNYKIMGITGFKNMFLADQTHGS